MAFLLITRVPVAARYLSIDNVNLAFALDNFDPRLHQPQPPGYPFFVLFAKILNVFFGDPETTFHVISVLVSALCLPAIYAIGARMFEPWVGEAAVWLLLVNPGFWYSGLDGPLRPNLALFSLLTAYCALRAWQGETRFIYWGAVALGVGSGFRPDLLFYLGPLWLLSAVAGTRSARTLLLGGALLAGIVLVWTGGLVYAVGGFAQLYELFETYLVYQSEAESVVMGAATQSWARQISRLVVWNGLAILEWVWAVPLFLVASERVPLLGRHSLFLIVWAVPGMILQALIHVAAVGHTLFSIPVFCVAGAYVLRAGLRRWDRSATGLTFAVIANVMLFLNFVPLPPAGSAVRVWNAFAYATFETSLEDIRWLDNIHGESLNEVRALRTPDRDTVIVAQDQPRKDWYLHWKIAKYYLQDHDIQVALDQKSPAQTMTVRGQITGPVRTGSPVDIPVGRRARILWIVELGGPFHNALSKAGVIRGGPRVFYTDIDQDTMPFQVMDFRIVPQPKE